MSLASVKQAFEDQLYDDMVDWLAASEEPDADFKARARTKAQAMANTMYAFVKAAVILHGIPTQVSAGIPVQVNTSTGIGATTGLGNGYTTMNWELT